MTARLIVIINLLFLLPLIGQPQTNNRFIPKNRNFSIPFDYDQKLIIVEVKLQDKVPLRFLFDTGSEYTILFDKVIADLLGIQFHRVIEIQGADLQSTLIAHVSEAVQLEITDEISIRQSILVLEREKLLLTELLGIRVDGILGMDAFRDLLLHLNYRSKHIRIIARDKKEKALTKHTLASSGIFSGKPHLHGTLEYYSGFKRNCNFLLDTGSEIPVLLHSHAIAELVQKEKEASTVLGVGLGGFVEGYFRRVSNLQLGTFVLEDAVVAIHTIDSQLIKNMTTSRHGLIGNSILEQCDPIIDLKDEEVYFSVRNSEKQFATEDHSGLFVVYADDFYHDLIIIRSIEGSPAYNSGLRKGDIIRTVNGWPAGFYTPTGMKRILKGKSGKRIKLKVMRDGKKIKYRFTLDSYITRLNTLDASTVPEVATDRPAMRVPQARPSSS